MIQIMICRILEIIMDNKKVMMMAMIIIIMTTKIKTLRTTTSNKMGSRFKTYKLF